MTTSISSSASRRPFAALAALALTGGCGPAEAPAQAPAHAPDRPASPTRVAAAPMRPRQTDARALYAADLTRAVEGAKKVAFPAVAGSVGDMACSPATISGASAASRKLTLTLPADAASRAHVLAVVTPERGLLQIYSPYDGAAEAGDLVIPSQTISWAKAKGQRRFATSTDALDGLRPGSDTPEPLFIEAGRYRFALVNGIDAALLKANGTQVKVIAACSFSWTP